jgi:hypothetical protein
MNMTHSTLTVSDVVARSEESALTGPQILLAHFRSVTTKPRLSIRLKESLRNPTRTHMPSLGTNLTLGRDCQASVGLPHLLSTGTNRARQYPESPPQIISTSANVSSRHPQTIPCLLPHTSCNPIGAFLVSRGATTDRAVYGESMSPQQKARRNGNARSRNSLRLNCLAVRLAQ